MGATLLALALVVSPSLPAPPSVDRETIADIRIHGNVATSDEEVRRLAGIEIGAPLLPDVRPNTTGGAPTR